MQLNSTPLNGTTNIVTITFGAGAAVHPSGSLFDGFYDLSINGNLITTIGGKFDGDADATPGGTFTETGSTAGHKLFRLFGDSGNNLNGNGAGAGDGQVDFLNDFITFRNAFAVPTNPQGIALFDFDNSGAVDFLSDFVAFRNRFNNPNTP